MRIWIGIDDDTEAGRYFVACARIRKIKPSSLFRRLLMAISEDQLVASVLDDADELKARKKGEHRFAEPKVA
jgi:hypothetical protein